MTLYAQCWRIAALYRGKSLGRQLAVVRPIARRMKRSSSVSLRGITSTTLAPASSAASSTLGIFASPSISTHRCSPTRWDATPSSPSLRHEISCTSASVTSTRRTSDREELAHLAAHHHFALSQDDHAIAQRLDVAQDVRREKDRLARASSPRKMRSRTSLRPTGSRPLIGSSSRAAPDRLTSAAARPVRCSMPFESRRTCRSAAYAIPVRSSTFDPRRLRSAPRQPAESAPTAHELARRQIRIDVRVFRQKPDALHGLGRRDALPEDRRLARRSAG